MASRPDKIRKKILVSCGQGKQIPETVFRMLERMKRSANKRVSDHVVMQLMRPFLKGRNVATELFYFCEISHSTN